MHRLFGSFLFAALVMGSIPGRVLRAQTEWTASPSGTTRSLWGVCYGGGLFVAVGEGGTIVTSPDGSTWTARSSGTTVWLTSVTYALGNYIAVGDVGTVLDSRDGIVWENVTARTPGAPTTRLNVVRFDGTEFFAYGEHNAAIRIFLPARLDWNSSSRDMSSEPWLRGFAPALGRFVVGGEVGLSLFPLGDPFLVDRNAAGLPVNVRNVSGIIFDRDTLVAVGGSGAIYTSTDVTTWLQQSSGTTADLQDVTAFNNTLIVVGRDGTILSLDEHSKWTRRTAPTAELLLGVAASDTTAVIVGTGGTILRSAAAAMVPTLVSQPASVIETLGGAASFVVRVNGSLPLAYQWFRNDVPLAGETRPELIRAPLTTNDAGSYTVRVTNSVGAVTSSPATLNLLPAPAPVVDVSFHADESLDGSPAALLPLPDGSVLVANGKQRQLVKLRSDGTLDPAWASSTFGPVSTFANPFINVLTIQPDGRILVGGSFATHNGQPRSNLIRLNRDGTFDSTFVPPVEATSRQVGAIALQADNRILIGNYGIAPVRLLSDGSLDPTFHPQPLEPLLTMFGQKRDWTVYSVAPAANGKMVVAVFVDLRFTLAVTDPRSMIVRLQNDGTLDPSFAPLRWNGVFTSMRVLDDDGVLAAGTLFDFNQLTTIAGLLKRSSSDGSPFPGYTSPAIGPIGASYMYPNGAVILMSGQQQSPVRFTPLGVVDPTFTGGVGQPSAIAATGGNQVFVAGSFTVYNGKPSQHVARLNVVPNESPNPPRILGFSANKTTVAYGDQITVRAAVVGSAELTYEWIGTQTSFSTTLRTTSPIRTFTFFSKDQSNTLQLVVRNPRGEATSAPIVFTVLPDAPAITSQPTRVSAQSGRDLTLRVEKNPTSGPADVEWRRDGQLLPRPGEPWFDGQTYFLPKITAADAGSYTLTLLNVLGATATSAPIVVTVDDSSRFANLSTRALVGSGEQTLIAGFAVSGYATRLVLLRGIGPALAKFGVTDALPDPQITLFNGAVPINFANDGWDANNTDGSSYLRTAFSAVGAFPLDPGSKDTAFTATLSPGSYTVQLTSKTGRTGTALIEIYEDDNDAARMLNVSSRAVVRPGSPAICGLSIQGPASKRVLLRAVGPALGIFGVSNPLVNPRLTLKDAGATTIATNDDWETNSNAGELRVASTAVGAFSLAPGSKDAALLVTLNPGNYTMIVEGGPGESGIALLEAYEVP